MLRWTLTICGWLKFTEVESTSRQLKHPTFAISQKSCHLVTPPPPSLFSRHTHTISLTWSLHIPCSHLLKRHNLEKKKRTDQKAELLSLTSAVSWSEVQYQLLECHGTASVMTVSWSEVQYQLLDKPIITFIWSASMQTVTASCVPNMPIHVNLLSFYCCQIYALVGKTKVYNH